METAYSVIKNMLWDEYGYTLPSDPSHITKQIIDSLKSHGYKIESYILNDNPKNMFGRESKEINGIT
jgi:predicted metal-dependent phosphotriesterase family hydrolase